MRARGEGESLWYVELGGAGERGGAMCGIGGAHGERGEVLQRGRGCGLEGQAREWWLRGVG